MTPDEALIKLSQIAQRPYEERLKEATELIAEVDEGRKSFLDRTLL